MTFFVLESLGRDSLGGSDGLSSRVIELSDYIPLIIPRTVLIVESRAKLPPNRWPEVRERYTGGESLRSLATIYGVSHEAIRQIVRREGTRAVL